ncbi:branched-chain amino acid ABC transporter permease [Saccharolobus solfataricus]|uniref:ABC transporter, permease (Branched chain amino acid) n=2 Tax=Saccharolobus solfataricus TaxID=2287 RepID=Q97UZ9_SACS2|nr:branched-chain amino acid ABC transporter permease [Saccharolobus solfataricus]AAK42948.1 ABC transporter, permease (branched chain amino acid) [Saccharolobus solfataricus P2]SAI86492.1 branched-chain amino acid ABC transporter permease [Saccharolobus solfataricus]
MIDPLIINTIVYGSILGLSSLSLTLTYLTTKVPNFAHGIFLLFGSYMTFTIAEVLKQNPYISLPIAFLLGGAIALLQYYGVLLPLSMRGGGLVSQMVATLAFSILLYGGLNAYASYLGYVYNVQSRDVTLGFLDYEIGGIRAVFLISIILAIAFILSLYIFLNKTRLGISIRATVENSSLAESMGINTKLVKAISWFLAGGIASTAGSLYPLQFVFSPTLAYSILLSIFAASVLGGLMSLFGGFIGGFIEGFIEKYIMTELSIYLSPLIGVSPFVINQYSTLVPLIVVAAVLLIAPNGIMGVRVK